MQGPVPAFLRRILYDGVEGSRSQASGQGGSASMFKAPSTSTEDEEEDLPCPRLHPRCS